ncbi:MAG: [FeFe] hydrogenase H-cluster maturation GTPase HydF [Bacteroidales bacterium]|nr:[FeFe] hydrogenase H-cluster maturation GTPase HydF [Bacteroidales bacterium]
MKPHIGIYGRTNSGKSTLINKLTGQPIAIVSDQAGTTTDPVKKSIEIFGIGPVILIDTAGIDDTSALGKQRVEKTYQTLQEIDCAILVIADNQFGTPEEQLIQQFQELAVPFIIVNNKVDLTPVDISLSRYIAQATNSNPIAFSALRDTPQPIVEALKKAIPESAYKRTSMLGGLVQPNDVIVLVTPIDDEAPEGRLILPQVMAIRNALDNDCICVVLKETNLQQYFDTMPHPDLVVTDSQAFAMVGKIVPQEVPLTSFSILLARLRGDFENYLKGTPHLSELKDGDKILMLESCTHEISCGDIGRVKLPALIRKFTGKDIQFDYVAGLAPIPNIHQYAMAIQCGGCVATRKQLINRTNLAVQAGIPISNYGMAIAYMTGIFNRAVAVIAINNNTKYINHAIPS